jgi:ATP-dependent 26S proteasome regulatory subunit
MRRRVLGALLIAVVSSLHALAIVRAASGLSCACIKAACTDATKGTAAIRLRHNQVPEGGH